MLLGKTLIWTAFIASLAALVGFALEFRAVSRAAALRRRTAGQPDPDPAGSNAAILNAAVLNAAGETAGARKLRWLQIARVLHGVALLALAGSVAYLMRLVLTHQFQFSYVYRYSSRDLPLHYLISTFWAGQEGTFLLWATYTALLGFIVSRTVKRFEPGVMMFIMLLQSFLLLILVRLSPFALYPMTPPDGAGLNPLLQDPWMVIHPPMLFLGFASTAIPAAFAMHAMARGDTDDWVRGALPWVAFSVLMLGTPICLGGYWAYKVLGWGGYWGWDPVENGSLVPWLASLALLHGLVVQNRRGLMKRLNLFLAVAAFMLVLYATFLTRSGVLGDFSVHSFVDLGINGYLIAFLVGYTLLALGLYIWRVRSMKSAVPVKNTLTREYGMFLGSLSICLFAIIVLIGTSSPLITRIGGGKPSTVATSYYEYSSIPFGILIGLLLTIVPQLLWGRKREKGWVSAFLSPVILGFLSAVLLYLVGVHKPLHLALVFSVAMSFFVNLEIMFGSLRKNPMPAGGFLAHAGISLMIIGIVTSTVYSRSDSVVLPKGEMVESFGYRMVWNGVRKIEGGKKEAYDIVVIPDKGASFTASPIMFFSEYNGGVMRRPAIHRFVQHDLYLSPQGVDRDEALDKMDKQEISLAKGETASLGDRAVLLNGFEPRMMTEARIEIAADVTVTSHGRSETVKPVIVATGEGQQYGEAMLADGTKLLMRRVDPKEGRALFYVRTPDSRHYNMPNEALFMDVSIKPWINVLWLGTFMAIGGLLMTVRHRAAMARRIQVEAESAVPAGDPEERPAGAAIAKPRTAIPAEAAREIRQPI